MVETAFMTGEEVACPHARATASPVIKAACHKGGLSEGNERKIRVTTERAGHSRGNGENSSNHAVPARRELETMPIRTSSITRCPEAVILGVTSPVFELACAICFHEYMFEASLTGVVLCVAVLVIALLLAAVANELARRRLIHDVTIAAQKQFLERQRAMQQMPNMPADASLVRQPVDSPNYVYGGYLMRMSSQEKLVINRATVWVGRGYEGVDLRIEGNSTISRRHACIIVRNGRAYITDNHTHKGTFVNNVRLSAGREQQLAPGDILYLGTERFRYDL